jgi:class 3 adenylate cyclase
MIHSIFGFCDVRQFTDTTECLQEEVMLFVNRIAHILHSIVVKCSGAANKNIGDAFLLTWKLDDKLNADQISNLADQALLTFCKALIELARYQDFICNFSVAATARLFKRFPEYNVRIGSGLHVGWAIEGAIGSNRKIDASYLSPHVSATEFLESSTKAYGVSLLISEPFFRLLSPAASKYCRQVDRIRRSATEEPFGLYTYDSDLSINWNDPHRHKSRAVTHIDAKTRLQNVVKRAGQMNKPGNDAAGAVGEESQLDHVKAAAGAAGPSRRTSTAARRPTVSLAVMRNIAVNEGGPGAADAEAPVEDEAERAERAKQTPTITVAKYNQAVWTEDADIVELRHRVNDSFRALWENGITAYIKGDWQKARDIFHETMRQSHGKDGPSKFLMEVIDEHQGTAPHDWPGYRDEGSGGH